MHDFVAFLLQRVLNPEPIPAALISQAWEHTLADVRYHFPEWTPQEIAQKVTSNSSELAIFLYRLGHAAHVAGNDAIKPQIHGLMRELCGCEIYFNNTIDEGFYVVHGVGTVLGSRNVIGKGFVIHQGCTIGHKRNGAGAGCRIGNNVKLYANCSLIGELYIGDDVTLGAHTLVYRDVPSGTVVLQKSPKS